MVRKRFTTDVLVLVVMLVLVLPTIHGMVSSSPTGGPDREVVDPYLAGVLERSDGDREMEVIVQFRDGITPADRRAMQVRGFDVLYEYNIIPAMWLRGTPRSVELLSRSDSVLWMEYNERLEYMMDETTNIINATRTWYSRIEGSLWGNEGLDGGGITVVVVDSGIDAGHPDLDYGTKTIRNLKSDTGTGPWYEIENGDTSSGHGTHVAGTVAGNGDASAGGRAGVARGANLIGLSVGEVVFVTGGLGALEWVYEHSQPGNNPYNIRVCTNSWGGGGGQYDPQDSISQAINKLVYENNVVVTFAAGNSGGDGETIQASNYGNTPAAICVAASERDGTGITDFSSKGIWNWVDTWPDVAAPGHNIESTSARRTLISLLQRGTGSNPYYFAISGTSMATPHVAGAAAVLFQAAPSLRVSDLPQDAGVVIEVDGTFTVTPPEEGSYGDLPYTYDEWMEDAPDTRIHEVELILKLTADYIQPQGEGSPDAHGLSENHVPDWSVPGLAAERQHDFSQGYGQINLHRAVGLALTLERIRWDEPGATVFDGYGIYEGIFERKEVSAATDRLTTGWSGEWSRFTEGPFKPATFVSNLTKFVYVPEGAGEVTVSMSYRPVDTTQLVAGSLGYRIDYGNDGSWDHDPGIGPDRDGTRTSTISISGNDGQVWRFEIYGVGFRLPRPSKEIQFQEARMEVEMAVSITFPSAQGAIVVNETDLHAINAHLRLATSSPDYTAGNVTVMMDVYNLNNIQWSPPVEPPVIPEGSGLSWWWSLLLLVLLAVVTYLIARFWPESRAGRLIIRSGTAVGAVQAYRWTKARSQEVYTKTKGIIPRKGVVKAELVEESEGPG